MPPYRTITSNEEPRFDNLGFSLVSLAPTIGLVLINGNN